MRITVKEYQIVVYVTGVIIHRRIISCRTYLKANYIFACMSDFQKPDMRNVPTLYETENIPAHRKIIYQKWEISQIGFYWLIAELDIKEKIAYGYANLNDDMFAEWGYISIIELMDNNAVQCQDWKPCTFEQAQKIMKQKRSGQNHI